jgi:electron-transferring-flavoprotein dehydrogenase
MRVAPAKFPPPVDNVAEFVGVPTDAVEERIEVGMAIVGGGPAGLACAIKAAQLLEREPALKEQLGEVPIAVIEKGKACGSHLLSGANMRPSAMRELFPDLSPEDWPVFQEVTKDAVYVLTKKRAIPLKPMPPNFRNHGNYVTSIAQLGRFLAEKAEELGVYVLSETAADKLLVEDRIVTGVRTGDKGRDREGKPLSNFEPGSDVIARATVLAEGTLGHLTTAAMDYYAIHGQDPLRWELGVKEIWEVPKPLDRVIHTMGWPLRTGAKYNEFGGSFIYPMGEDKVCIGFVAGLDYTDATFSCHDVLQEFKTHPFVRNILEGGRRIGWGAKTIPSGGWWSMPKHLSVPGMCIAGDAACMLNVPELKGIHYAMHAGMYAAETIVDSLKENSINFEAYDRKVRESTIGKDLYRSRNMRQPFSHGFFVGGALAFAMTATRGAFPGGHWRFKSDAEEEMFIDGAAKNYPKPDNKYLFDKLSSVFASGNATRDDAPNHIRVQQTVPYEIAQAWTAMCPAQVYEIPEDVPEHGEVTVQITPSNCIQCGAINAKGGRLTLPEGGDGPNYTLA